MEDQLEDSYFIHVRGDPTIRDKVEKRTLILKNEIN